MPYLMTGVYRCNDNGIYYVQSSISEGVNTVWWAGFSHDGEFHNGLTFCNIFIGVIGPNDLLGIGPNQIRGRWYDVPRGLTRGQGGLLLTITNPTANPEPGQAGFVMEFKREEAESSVGFGGSIWTLEHAGGASDTDFQDIFDVFDKVKKNQNQDVPPDHSLLDNLKPFKKHPVSIIGTVIEKECDDPEPQPYPVHVNYRIGDGRGYRDFICLDGNNSPPDGDINFTISVDRILLDAQPQFWSDDWATDHGMTPEIFQRKLDRANCLHCEVIMFGRTAECGDDGNYEKPPLLPGWQELNGNSVLINGRPINGQLGLSPVEPKFEFRRFCKEI